MSKLPALLAVLLAIFLTVPFLPLPVLLPSPGALPLDTLTLTPDHLVDTVPVLGGESLVYHQGEIITGTLDGYLMAFDPDTLEMRWRRECRSADGAPCRVLGLRSAAGLVYGVEEKGGLFRFTGREFEWLLDPSSPQVRDIGPGFWNDLVVHGDMIYISDSFPRNSTHSMLQRFYSFRSEGRLLSFNLVSGRLSILADGLRIPNGLELEHGNQGLLVAEGSAFRVVRVDLSTGAVRVWSDRTLGAVDNIRRFHDGYWFGVSASRFTSSSYHDVLARSPTLRYLLTSHPLTAPILKLIPRFLGQGAVAYRTDLTGKIVRAVFDKNKISGTVTFSEVCVVGDFLFVGNPFSNKILRIPK